MRGFPDAQSPKAVSSPFTRLHRGSQRGSLVSLWKGGRRAEALLPLLVRTRTEADNVGSPPRAGTIARRARPRGGSTTPIVVRPRVNGRVNWPGDDAHRDPFTWAGAGPVGSHTVIALVGIGVDQMREPALNEPLWAEVATTLVVFPTRVIRSDRILLRYQILAGRFDFNLQEAAVHTTRRRPFGTRAMSAQSHRIGQSGSLQDSFSALSQFTLTLRTTRRAHRGGRAARIGLITRVLGPSPRQPNGVGSPRDASKQEVLRPRRHAGLRNGGTAGERRRPTW